MMKAVIALAVFVLAAAPSFAEDKETKPPTPAQQAQRERMKACNAEAGKQQLKGDARKTFMSTCLKAEKS